MLTDHLETHRDKFDALASAWMRVGATCLQLLDGKDNLLLAYPEQFMRALPVFVLRSQSSDLSLRVYGDLDESWRSAAETVLSILSNLLTSDSELDSLAAALVDAQDRLVAIYELTQATRHTLDISVLLELLIQESKHLLEVDGGFAILMEKGKPTLMHQISETPLQRAHLEAAAALFRRDPVRHTFKDQETVPLGLQNVMMVSVPVRDEIFAVLGVFNQTGNFTTPDIKLAETIAGHIGAQLENALLHKESVERARLDTEMDIARQVQIAILPQKLPSEDGLDIFGTSVPAYEVGGDFFDAVARDTDSLAFAVGDVTGKGMPAALLMSMTHTIIKSSLRRMPFTHPHQVLERLNCDLFDDFSNVGMFTTVLVGELNRSTNVLTMSNAGHSPVYYIPVGRDPILMEAQDIPIGLFDDYNYSSQALQLMEGDILVIASDGFPESRNPADEMFGYERMKNSISGSRNLSAQGIGERLLADVVSFCESHPQDDDRTLIVIKVTENHEH